MFNFSKRDNSVRRKNFFLRRSIFSTKSIKKNEKITKDNINSLRPKIGICASQYFNILGKKVKKNIKANEPILKNHLL